MAAGVELVVVVGLVVVVALTLPYTRVGAWLSLVPLPLPVLVLVLFITVAYVLTVELFKRWFFGWKVNAPSRLHR